MKNRARVWHVLLVLASVVLLLLATLALPVPMWRSGDQQLAPMRYAARVVPGVPPERLWIDTDAACGTGRRVDPDDCLALLLLVRSRGHSIVGVSTVFGNAPRPVVDRTTSALFVRLEADGLGAPPVYHGADRPRGSKQPTTAPTPASRALIATLEAGPLTILALGPLTTIAAALEARPDLAARVLRLIAVMGRRPGHVFHPAEGARAASFLGHGPIFRDFNFAQDPDAVRSVMRLGLPVTLVPYDAARTVEFGRTSLRRVSATGRTGTWLSGSVGEWLAYWQSDIGREGFSPFDLVAALYVLEPESFGCAETSTRVGQDERLTLPLRFAQALLVGPADPWLQTLTANGPVLYCAVPPPSILDRLHDLLEN